MFSCLVHKQIFMVNNEIQEGVDILSKNLLGFVQRMFVTSNVLKIGSMFVFNCIPTQVSVPFAAESFRFITCI